LLYSNDSILMGKIIVKTILYANLELKRCSFLYELKMVEKLQPNYRTGGTISGRSFLSVEILIAGFILDREMIRIQFNKNAKKMDDETL
jgi:hypothetical protein